MRKKKSWDKKWYSDSFLLQLKDTARVRTDGDLPITEKYAPDACSPIGIDPRLLGGPIGRNAKKMALLPPFLLDKLKYRMSGKALKKFRVNCARSASAVCVRGGVDLQNDVVYVSDGYAVPVRIYRSPDCVAGAPCVLFFHGGGFIAGELSAYDEAWKVFVRKFSIPVVSVAYRLLPENPYPLPYEDCFCALQWLYSNAETLRIDRKNIFVAGDSAGGNLAQYCSTKAKNSGMVRGQLLLYPALNPFRIEDAYYRLGKGNFVYEPKQKKLSRCITKQLEMMIDAYAEVTGIAEADEMCDPYISSAVGNPPTFLAVGALDFLKIDAVAWAHKLHDSGVPVKVVMYNGMGHGFLNATGVFPQAEDCLDEMGEFIKRVISS